MKPTFAAFAAAILVTGAAFHAISAKADLASPTVWVNIDNYAYKAPTVTVATGTTVVFKNFDDDPHTVTSNDGLFDSKGLAQGDTWTYRFTKPGKYTYYCKVHPYMKGTVIVKEIGS
jgi:plastocyanin